MIPRILAYYPFTALLGLMIATAGCPALPSPGTGDGLSAGDSVSTPVATQRTIRADAGDTQVGGPGDLVVLNGNHSAPGQGARLSYFWKQVDGPFQVELIDGFSSNPRFFVPENVTPPARLTFQLTVIDGFATATDQVDVVIPSAAAP